ncbi:hypothetical protein MRB53_037644 [Persea americana]|nr:hypothetical protein MRB53_037644 [Persea americana]
MSCISGFMLTESELDVNLLDEKDLYDINIIGSMLKAWLRELPDELLPKATQARIAAECSAEAGHGSRTPQMMKDELSQLPPFNYYLLFAITCHISVLHTNAAKNKMNYHNLCICFQPCIKIDAFCFQFLVLDWKNCWQGCWTEKEYLTQEMKLGNALTPGAGRSVAEDSITTEEAAISTSGSSRPDTGRSAGMSDPTTPPALSPVASVSPIGM